MSERAPKAHRLPNDELLVFFLGFSMGSLYGKFEGCSRLGREDGGLE